MEHSDEYKRLEDEMRQEEDERFFNETGQILWPELEEMAKTPGCYETSNVGLRLIRLRLLRQKSLNEIQAMAEANPDDRDVIKIITEAYQRIVGEEGA